MREEREGERERKREGERREREKERGREKMPLILMIHPPLTDGRKGAGGLAKDTVGGAGGVCGADEAGVGRGRDLCV